MTNPLNNAIGSHWNNTVQFKFGLDYDIHPNWEIKAGFSFTHFSNGGSQLPNFGINIPAFLIGAKYTPMVLEPKDYILHGASKATDKKWSLSLHAGLAFREIQAAGGPRYPIYIGSMAGVYAYSRLNRSYLGLEYEYNQAAYRFGQDVFAYNSPKEAFWGASRVSLFGAHEFLFGDWGIYLQSGVYLGDFSFLLSYPFYFKIATRYYLPPIGKPPTQFYVGLYLKSHLFIAEYLTLGVGAAF